MKSISFAILKLLSDGEFHSGTKIAQLLGVSRASVSNALHGIDEFGVVLYRVTGKGYRWINPIQWLDKRAINQYLAERSPRFRITIDDVVESTNTILLNTKKTRYSDQSMIDVVVAELQTKGRGRRGRSWFSGLGDSLTFSLSWQFQQGVNFLAGLSLAVGVGIIRTFVSLGISDIALKWPNDLLSNTSKLGGVLIELQGEVQGPATAVIGIGINLAPSSEIKHYVDQDITDLYSITNAPIDRNKLLASLLIEITAVLEIFADEGFSPFKEEWISYHAYEAKEVEVLLPAGSIERGIVTGITEDGSLRLKMESGLKSFHCGEISLRKIN
ncbi:MAG: bifunctional biotin--[acetyl-CoA-carboxylase] ligase/biotin operon repressor BirA [Nitrosomonas sp.]|nr:bifunctional biotin--[acetyl-CoA-carboxylase] ligase/biotin operon repressor BirA [Nitrosomonas sp.]MBK7364381.1 bifunctional biotin--[acetyl-CoA-carboxylase] ligase/biotin operon repressor BirA [Nitrosomonas sp.]